MSNEKINSLEDPARSSLRPGVLPRLRQRRAPDLQMLSLEEDSHPGGIVDIPRREQRGCWDLGLTQPLCRCPNVRELHREGARKNPHVLT